MFKHILRMGLLPCVSFTLVYRQEEGSLSGGVFGPPYGL